MNGPRVAYFTIRYPTLSQTFLQREVETLREQGIAVEVYPCWQWGTQPVGESLFAAPTAPVYPLGPPALAAMPLAWMRESWRWRAEWKNAVRLLSSHRPQSFEGWFMTLWGTAYALQWAGRLRGNVPDHFHGAWATGPATIAALLGRRFGRPFSFGAHAYDVYRDGGDSLLDVKLRQATFVHTTTQQTEAHLLRRVPQARVILSRRGLPTLPEWRAPGAVHAPIRILSVGRLVEKKGHHHQLAACAVLLRRGLPVHLRVVGGGPLETALREETKRLGLAGMVEFPGAQSAEAVAEHYRWADLFWHTGVVDAEGDRDGLPNVLPEAMAHGVPVISCREAGAMEAVSHDVTGWTVDIRNAEALADAVQRLCEIPVRQRLAVAARHWVETNFVSATNTALLAHAFRAAGSKP